MVYKYISKMNTEEVTDTELAQEKEIGKPKAKLCEICAEQHSLYKN